MVVLPKAILFDLAADMLATSKEKFGASEVSLRFRPYAASPGKLQGESYSGPDHYELNVEFVDNNSLELYIATVERAKPKNYDSNNHGAFVEWGRLYPELKRRYPGRQWMFVWEGVDERVETLARTYHTPGVALTVYGPGPLQSYAYEVIHAFKISVES